ncbi:hypothetical protein QYE76_051322 [Lolium multiflorum]|uniref:Transposase (putative) gypsy type domain-containing protein n=1 Tax=Lolium multiflorum TaxID=4521 RepID=A0AAD8SRN8_LOLMU|nr:hypothetical protein QYE76_051322 [Lolium multiflorum]
MAAADLGAAEWERSKITNQDLNLLKKLGITKKPKAVCFPSEESYPTPPMGYRVSFVDHLIRGLSAPIHPFLRGLLYVYGLQLHHLTPNSILHISIFITLCEAFLGVQPNWALWKRIFFCRRNGSANVAYNIGGVVISVRSSVNYFDVKLPDSVQGWRKKWLYIREENHGCAEDNIPPFDGLECSLFRLAKNGIMLAMKTRIASTNTEVKDLDRLIRKISSLKKKDSIPSTYRVKPYSAANALPKDHPNLVSLPPLPEGGEVEERAVISDDNQDAPSFANEPAESRKSAGSDEKRMSLKPLRRHNLLLLLFLQGTKGKGMMPKIPAPPRPKKLSLLTRRQVMIHTSRLSSVLMMKKKYQLLMWLLERPMIKELLRIGAQFVGYRDYASKTEEKLAEANERADTLAQKLEQCEEARKKAESDAVEARQEADKAKADAAGVEDLRKRLHDAETSLSEHITAQSAREAAITKRIRTQNRRFVNRTSQEFELENPDNDSLLDAVSFLEFHGTEAREGMDEARAGLSKLFPYFFPKKEEPATFLGLAKCFNPPEDLGLKMRHENMKVAVESTVALVADSQQTIDWAKVGDTEQIEQTKWRSLIKAAKLNTKKILAYLGIKPSSTPSSSKPEV